MRQLPKNVFLQNLTIAFAKGDSKFILSSITDDVRWNIVGDKLIESKEKLAEAVDQMKANRALELTIHRVATHGKAGAVNGTVVFEDGKTLAFCHVFEFSGVKGSSVKGIISYIIEIK